MAVGPPGADVGWTGVSGASRQRSWPRHREGADLGRQRTAGDQLLELLVPGQARRHRDWSLAVGVVDGDRVASCARGDGLLEESGTSGPLRGAGRTRWSSRAAPGRSKRRGSGGDLSVDGRRSTTDGGRPPGGPTAGSTARCGWGRLGAGPGAARPRQRLPVLEGPAEHVRHWGRCRRRFGAVWVQVRPPPGPGRHLVRPSKPSPSAGDSPTPGPLLV